MKKNGLLTSHVLTGFAKILISDAEMQDGGSFVNMLLPPPPLTEDQWLGYSHVMVCREVKVDHVTVLNNFMQFCTFFSGYTNFINFCLNYNLSLLFFSENVFFSFFFYSFFLSSKRRKSSASTDRCPGTVVDFY